MTDPEPPTVYSGWEYKFTHDSSISAAEIDAIVTPMTTSERCAYLCALVNSHQLASFHITVEVLSGEP